LEDAVRAYTYALLASALAGTPFSLAYAEEARTTSEGLVERNVRGIDVAFVRPGADWRKYRTILILPLIIPPEARDGSGNQRNTTHPGESYILRQKDVEDIQAGYERQMREEFTKDGRFTLVTEPQADTLVIASSILRLILAAPIESSRANYAGRGHTFTTDSGAATMASTFADGGDYTVLARIADNRYGNDMGGMNTRVRSLANMNMMFSQWGRAIRERLEGIQDGRITPAS
jgi:hypothetical protein